MNFEDKDWFVKDVSEEVKSTNVFEIRGFSEVLEEDTEICTVWANDINCEEQLENINLIKKAPEMFRLLKVCHEYFEKTNSDKFMAEKVNELLEQIKDTASFSER